jgi:putative ABC transport system permease protein
VSLNLRLAWRNIWRQKRRTWLTALAMIFSNLLLVFMISLQFGSYDMMINNTLQTLSGHLQVQNPDFNTDRKIRYTLPGITQLSENLRAQLLPMAVSARAEAFALASSKQRTFGIQVLGVEPQFEADVSNLPGLIADGRFLQDANAAEMVIGSVLARNLKVTTGDEITLLGSDPEGGFAAGIATVVGIIDSGSKDLDRSIAEVPLGWFQETFAMHDTGHAIVVNTGSLAGIPAARQIIIQALGPDSDLIVLDWDALHPGLKQAIQADLSSAWFMYGVLIILVSFSVLNTMLMSVLERTREFGVIMALGVPPGRMAYLVLLETFVIASLGLIIGACLGWIVAMYFNLAGFSYPGMEEIGQKFNLPAKVYPSVTWFSVFLGPGIVFMFSMIAAVYPALRLFKLQPVDAMRSA